MKKIILKGLFRGLLWGGIAVSCSYLWWNSHTLLNPVVPATEAIPGGIGVALLTFVMSVLDDRKKKINKA